MTPTLDGSYGTLPADDYRGPVPPEVEEAIQRQWMDLLGDGYDIVVRRGTGLWGGELRVGC